MAVTDRDRSATDLFLWARKRTVSANGHAGIGGWSPKDAWLELHFGDNCWRFYRGNAFGTYMGLSTRLHFYVIPPGGRGQPVADIGHVVGLQRAPATGPVALPRHE